MAAEDDDDDTTATSTPSFRFRWDVFLSFRGEDTRHGFTADLYEELVRNGVRTFRDEEGLDQGEDIQPSLVEAIEDSAASVAIISEKYASSRWCLDELAKIVELRRWILPVFYKVDPSDVRRQKGPFEDDFLILERRFGIQQVSKWRKAMEKAGGISGWDSKLWEEPQLIQFLVKKVLTKLSNTPLDVAKYPVGLNAHLETLVGMINIKAGGVRVLGFHGMGGIGKTTLAKALYNKLVIHFKRRSFISNVRETSRQQNGLTSLQNMLINNLSSSARPSANDVSEGILSIKEDANVEPVLIVLDDVDHVNQLNALAGGRDWFHEGSRIIITTRDKEILNEKIVDAIYEVKELSGEESRQLFSYHAFGREKPPERFQSRCDQVVSLTGSLPLALEVFGSFLFYRRTTKEWDESLQKLQQIRPRHLQDVLELSFNELDEQEKRVFLDIACFFATTKTRREDAIDIFKGCGFHAELALTVLTSRSLIRIIGDNILGMHDQLRDMGRQIVQRENPGDPGMRSRLWDRDEIMAVLKNEKGTRSIQGITLDIEKIQNLRSAKIGWMSFQGRPGIASAYAYLKGLYRKYIGYVVEKERDLIVCTKSFKAMVNLRLLQINHVEMVGNFKLLPAELKWLQWKGCPLKTLPPEFQPQDLTILDLSESKITQVWGQRWGYWYRTKMAENLLVMNLSHCYHLTYLPDLSGLRLEKLILESCVALIKVHESVGDLTTLTQLNLKNCFSLVEFTSDVSGLKSLENLILSGCSELKELPKDMSGLKSLKELLVDKTAIVMLPDSIFRFKKLERFSLNDCWLLNHLPGVIGKLISLVELSLDGSSLKELPDSVGNLTNLEKLSLRGSKSLTSIPDSISNIKYLTELVLDNSSIKELPASIGSLVHLKNFSVNHCRSLTKLPDTIGGLASLIWLRLEGTLITEVPDQIGELNTLEKLELGYSEKLISLPRSIGNLSSLTTLALHNNVLITELPESIGFLEILKVLKLNNCINLRRLPAAIGRLKKLRYLYMNDTAVEELPEEFGMLRSLRILKMAKPLQHNLNNLIFTVLPVSFSNLSSLENLDACAWRLSGRINDDFELLSSLEILNLGHNNFCSLPCSLRGLSVLKKLLLPQCKELKFLPPLPSSLIWLNVANCNALESVPDLSNLASLEELQLTNCKRVMDIPGLECLKSLRRLYTSGCNACFPAIKRRLAKVALKRLQYLSVPGTRIPDWFVQEIPSLLTPKNRELKGVIIGVVVALDKQNHDDYRGKLEAIVDIQAKIIRLNDPIPIHTKTLYLLGVPDTDEDQLYLCRFEDYSAFVRMLITGDKIQVAMRPTPHFRGLQLKKCGIYLVFENDDDNDDDDDEESFDESQQSVSKKLSKFFSTL